MEEVRSAPGKKWSGWKSRLLTVYHNQGLLFNVPQDSLPLYWRIVFSCTFPVLKDRVFPVLEDRFPRPHYTLRITHYALRITFDLSRGTGLTCPARH